MTRNDLVSVGPAVPGVVLRGAAVAVAVATAVVLGAPPGWLIATGALVVVGAVVAASGGIWVAAGTLVVALVLQPMHPGRAAVAIAAVHLLHVLAALVAVVPWRARIALRALVPSARRLVLIQALVQAVFFAVYLVPRTGAVPAAVVVAAGAALGVAVVMTRMLRRGRGEGHARPDDEGTQAGVAVSGSQPGVGGAS